MIATDYKPLERRYPLTRLRPGDTVWTWCSRHMDRTNHIWTGNKLICLECQPEMKPKEATNDDRDKRPDGCQKD